MELESFNPSSSAEDRAVQAWQILVSAAMNRQTLTYKLLSEKIFQTPAQGVLNKILGHIAFYCQEVDLEPLTSIVVNKNNGTPGEGIPEDQADMAASRERVYDYDWYNVYPPTSKELSEAYQKNT